MHCFVLTVVFSSNKYNVGIARLEYRYVVLHPRVFNPHCHWPQSIGYLHTEYHGRDQ